MSTYANELQNLPDVYGIAMRANINELTKVVERIIDSPLVTTGSGGSFSTSSYVAEIHKRITGNIAVALTPLQIIEGMRIKSPVFCFSASGKNHDICGAFENIAMNQSGLISVLTMSENSPLMKLVEKHQHANAVILKHDLFNDGFLSVATYFASVILMERAYSQVLGTELGLPQNLMTLEDQSLQKFKFPEIEHFVSGTLSRRTVSMLYSTIFDPIAIDLESRFVEGALGNLQTSDFRNFGHGRHNWLTQHGQETGIISLISNNSKQLAEKTLSLIPDSVEKAHIIFHGSESLQRISALISGLYISLAAGNLASIDPGNPIVPEFGRKIFDINPGS